MKYPLVLVALLILSSARGQETIPPTDHFSIEGKVKKRVEIGTADLATFPVVTLDSVVITNHLRQRKGVLMNVKGALLKDVLARAVIDADDVKILSRFYIVCIASDNYKVVFSWNELFNSETGDHVLVITEKDGKKLAEMADRIALLSPTDLATGRRFLKGLKSIVIEEVN